MFSHASVELLWPDAHSNDEANCHHLQIVLSWGHPTGAAVIAFNCQTQLLQLVSAFRQAQLSAATPVSQRAQVQQRVARAEPAPSESVLWAGPCTDTGDARCMVSALHSQAQLLHRRR